MFLRWPLWLKDDRVDFLVFCLQKKRFERPKNLSKNQWFLRGVFLVSFWLKKNRVAVSYRCINYTICYLLKEVYVYTTFTFSTFSFKEFYIYKYSIYRFSNYIYTSILES